MKLICFYSLFFCFGFCLARLKKIKRLRINPFFFYQAIVFNETAFTAKHFYIFLTTHGIGLMQSVTIYSSVVKCF